MKRYSIIIALSVLSFFCGCNSHSLQKEHPSNMPMKEKQITFTPKTHALDNNDNFSPDDRFLCYDTRGTVFNEDLANSKSIEKVEIATGQETILWDPPAITGKNAAPGVAAVSYHPFENKVIFINGPFLKEVPYRGYYSKQNRTAIEADGNGNKTFQRVDMRDITNNPTTPGAHRGGTHRHEYCRNGDRIGFTYDDFLVSDYDRTIGFMEPNNKVPEGYTHYFCLILKPAPKGQARPGEIEKAYGDSWVNAAGTMRAFIGKVRQMNGVDYDFDLFVADIPTDIDITTADPGTMNTYPTPPKGISIRRLTTGMNVNGIVRGSFDGKRIAFLAKDKNEIDQVYVINADGSEKQASLITHLEKNAESVRWHNSGNWIFYLSAGNVYSSYVGKDLPFGKTFQLSDDDLFREQLVVSKDGNKLAYIIRVPTKNTKGEIIKDAGGMDFRQIFIMDINWDKIEGGEAGKDQEISNYAEIIETKVICKQTGHYIGWPTITKTRSGELLVVFSGNREAHVCPYGITQLIRSNDNGKTWSNPETINDTPLDDRDAGILETKTGTLLVNWFTSLAFDNEKYFVQHPDWKQIAEKLDDNTKKIWLGNWTRRSLDGGKSWEEPVKQLVSSPHGPIELSDGRLIYVGTAYVDGRKIMGVEQSTDDGQSWQLISSISLSNKDSIVFSHEPHAVELKNGKILVMFRYNPSDHDQSFLRQSESYDGGKNWTTAHETAIWGYPPHLIQLKNGWILNTYGVRRKPFGEKACISKDDGETWETGKEIMISPAMNGDLGYPASVQLNDGSILTVYYQIDKKGEKTSLMSTHWCLNEDSF